jgi:DNA helicase-2/ATP-dependent DNA helicase PcrA
MLQITDTDISNAEQILFGKKIVFDKERRDFISCFESCDLQAVPGSGKTTALMAKLLVLEKYLPLSGDRGVLVISHTNAAVNEIKQRIGSSCPQLFSYPNFVGTIQSFVDEFLAKPYYASKTNKKVRRIDNETYEENAGQYSNVFIRDFTKEEQNKGKSWLRSNDNYKKLRLSHDDEGEVIVTTEYFGKEVEVKKPKGNARVYTDWNEEEKKRVKEWLLAFRTRILRSGNLCFDDAYFLAFEYLKQIPKIHRLLQLRFQFVFIDEMQDMEEHQYSILEKIFGTQNDSLTCFQRIGDKNQAIYNTGTKLNDIWKDREKVLRFTGSHRLPAKIAKVVESLALFPINVRGMGTNNNGSPIDLPSHFFVYDDTSVQKVIPAFATATKKLIEEGKMPPVNNKTIKAICWNTKPEDNEAKVRIGSYFPNYSKEDQKLSIHYPCLAAYFYEYDKTKRTFFTLKKNILNGLLKVLRIEGVIEEGGVRLTKKSLLAILKQNHFATAEKLEQKVYQWCLLTIKGKADHAIEDMRTFIPELLSCFGKSISECVSFLQAHYVPLVAAIESKANPFAVNNVYSAGDFDVQIATVHSVKGQTHTATLYLESFYQRSIKKSGSFESERLAPQIKGVPLPQDAHEFVKQSMKMAYVGFSRPTHFLGFAVHKDRFEVNLKEFAEQNKEDWTVVYV